jgi:exoribonuclease-2
MERYWTLKFIQQQGMTEIVGTLFKDGLVRADHVPLVLPVLGGYDLPRGAHVRVKLGEIDLITLDVSGTVVERLDLPEEPVDEIADEGDDEPVAGPIAIAVDVNETEDSPAVTGDNTGS